MQYQKVPDETIRRLPRYLRALLFLQQRGIENVSSQKLSEYVQLNSTQIRKDLSHFGAFGKRGTGYNVVTLSDTIRNILKLNKPQKTVLVGAGRLGAAIASFPGFERYGFDISAVYDNSKNRIGKKIGHTTVRNTNRLTDIKKSKIKTAIIATPPDAAQETAEILIKNGVTGILNLSSCYLRVPKKVKVRTIDLAMELIMLPYYA